MDTDSKCKVSIIVPVYNTEKEYLKECIDSLVNQTLNDIEIVLVDDGSQNATGQLVDDLALSDSRIKAIHKPNGGVSSARNVGIKESSGKYLTFLDADDWMDLKCCELSYKAAERNNAEMVTWRHVKVFGKKQEESYIFQGNELIYCFDEYVTDSKKDNLFNPYDMRVMGYTTMKLFRRDIIDNQEFRSELTNGEDVEFNFRLYKKIKRAVYLDKPFYKYRQLSGSAVRGFDKKAISKYSKTLYTILNDIEDSTNTMIKDAYLDFTAISYLMICMNYIFNPDNKTSFRGKLKMVRNLSSMKPYKDAVCNANKLGLPKTRKASLVFAKYKLYFGVYLTIKTKILINKMYS